MTAPANFRVRRLLSQFLTLPGHKHLVAIGGAPDSAYIMKDLGFTYEAYADFLEELELEFGIPRGADLTPRDETIESVCRIIETRQWPQSWR